MTYLTPVVGLVLGVLVLGERATWNLPAGAAVIVAVIVVAQGRLKGARQRAARFRQGRPGMREDYSI